MIVFEGYVSFESVMAIVIAVHVEASGEESQFSLVSLILCLHVKKQRGFANENHCVWFSNVLVCLCFFR